LKAVDAAINSRQWKKAVDILSTQESSSVSIYYKKIADYFATMQEFEVLKKIFLLIKKEQHI
jgi:intraflagellar transport protein 172